MPEPQSSRHAPGEPSAGVADEARIEQLLVAGLDQYFTGDFESAINIWTRVLFLDRQHDRARAYIERARTTLAERQRQTEALVHQGLDAFDRGDVEHARLLLSDALDRGASQDLTLGVLGRIERLDLASRGVGDSMRVTGRSRPRPPGRPTSSGEAAPSTMGFWAIIAMLLVVLVGSSWWLWTTSGWQTLWPATASAGRMATIPEVNAPLPVPSVAEVYMRRGHDLFESGKLRDALESFNRVPPGDPLRPAADEMRAHIQRELLALALPDTAGTAPARLASGSPRK